MAYGLSNGHGSMPSHDVNGAVRQYGRLS